MGKTAVGKILTALATACLLLSVSETRAELSIVSGSAAMAAQAHAPTSSDWVYTLSPGETLESVARDLLVRSISSGQLRQYNRLDKQAEPGEGDTIRIPLSWMQRQPDPARITSVTGNVQLISAADSRSRPARSHTLVRVGDAIKTGSGTATIELANGTLIRLSPDSHMVFNCMTQFGKSGMVDTRLRLDQGQVNIRVEPLSGDKSRFEVETPSAVAAVRGTVFTLQTSGTGTRLAVTQGAVDFGRPGKTQRIPAGYSASVSDTPNTGLAIRRLPPAPQLNPLPPRLTTLPVEISWQPAATGQYQLDILDLNSGTWVDSRRIQGDHTSINALDNGTYDIQLSAIDARGLASIPASATIEVDLQAKAATLVAPQDSATAEDNMPEFRWALNGNSEQARVEIARNSTFTSMVTTSEWTPDTSALPEKPLEPGTYFWRVVTRAGGDSTSTSEIRKLEIDGSLPPVHIISVNYVDHQVRVFWEKVNGAKGYLLQLSEEPEFTHVIKEATLPDTTAALRLIPGRRYFVRLKAISDGSLSGRWGPGRELYLD